jgi:Cytochrome c, mono- and diheme variants
MSSRFYSGRLRGFVPLIFLLILGIATYGCQSSSGRSVKFDQYYVQGEMLYVKHCSNCHQKNGAGLGLVYPPLDKSDYMDNNFEAVVCIMKYGTKGEVTVNGKIYNQPMPGVPSLTELEIAEIATYIYNTWNHSKGIIETPKVSEALAKCID